MTAQFSANFLIVAACIIYPVFGIGVYLVSRYLKDSGKLKILLFIPILIGFIFGAGLLLAVISDLPG